MKNDFPEKEFYPRKIEKFRRSQETLEQLINDLRKEYAEIEQMTNEMLNMEHLNNSFTRRYSKEIRSRNSIRDLESETNHIGGTRSEDRIL